MTTNLTPGQLTTPQAARAFLLGGHAVLTLVSKKTGTRFTYRVSEAPVTSGRFAERQSAPRTFFVSVLTGPENTSDYAYIGLLKPDTSEECTGPATRFFRTAKSRVKDDSAPSFMAFRYLVRALFFSTLDALLAELEVWHQGSCGKCGRPLTVPESIASGIGPVCASK
jgi:hypothetical protein